MRKDVYIQLTNKPELRQFVRQHPHWYRKLNREPHSISTLEQEANQFYGKTFPQRIERLQGNLNLAMMMIQMLQSTVTNQGQQPTQPDS
ncbi:YlbE-like family protein [Alkalihalobacillus sp. LMS39]|uniref:YlbE-like family protein n=1 Tax=Alkalihalobacillus sp. LMS39 TaxID=2924032 RepID=UPI001FB3BA2A|nr:YlbE-like family protein [Alkalihalobacillus sp. LMS39]UOE92959.1 YlbE-like family protein [Alkalihalobacillus sp. LMS39]